MTKSSRATCISSQHKLKTYVEGLLFSPVPRICCCFLKIFIAITRTLPRTFCSLACPSQQRQRNGGLRWKTKLTRTRSSGKTVGWIYKSEASQHPGFIAQLCSTKTNRKDRCFVLSRLLETFLSQIISQRLSCNVPFRLHHVQIKPMFKFTTGVMCGEKRHTRTQFWQRIQFSIA